MTAASSSGRPPRRPSRLAAQPHPATAPAPPELVQEPDVVDTPAPDAAVGEAPPMPPRRRRGELRVQLNTRIPQSVRGRTDEFVTEHDAALQDVVETALTEYLDRRGAPPWTDR